MAGWRSTPTCRPRRSAGWCWSIRRSRRTASSQRLVEGLVKAHRKFATGIFALWYPLKEPQEVADFAIALRATGIAKMLRIELTIRKPSTPPRLHGTGMIVVNPPFVLEDEMRVLLPPLAQRAGGRRQGRVEARLAARGVGDGGSVDLDRRVWLVSPAFPGFSPCTRRRSSSSRICRDPRRDAGRAAGDAGQPGRRGPAGDAAAADPNAAEGEFGTLYGHLAKANQQGLAPADGEALAIFMGPDAYVTPSWYATKHTSREGGADVELHLRCTPMAPVEFFDDADRLHALVSRLTTSIEQTRPQPWAVADAPEPFVSAQLRGIIGLRMPITRLEGKRKMSQNRVAEDREGVLRPVTEQRAARPCRRGADPALG